MVRCRERDVSGLLLKNGDFVACVYRGLVDDFAIVRANAIAGKVVKKARKKFAKLTFRAFDRDISAWDYFCVSQHAGAVSGADKFISDFIRLAIVKRLEDMSAAELHLLALSDIPFDAIDETTEVTPERVFRRVQREVLRLAGSHGGKIAVEGMRMAPPTALAPASRRSSELDTTTSL